MAANERGIEVILLSPVDGHNCQCNWLTILLITGRLLSQIQCHVSKPLSRINRLNGGQIYYLMKGHLDLDTYSVVRCLSWVSGGSSRIDPNYFRIRFFVLCFTFFKCCYFARLTHQFSSRPLKKCFISMHNVPAKKDHYDLPCELTYFFNGV